MDKESASDLFEAADMAFKSFECSTLCAIGAVVATALINHVNGEGGLTIFIGATWSRAKEFMAVTVAIDPVAELAQKLICRN